MLGEVAVGDHARQLDHPAQLDLAPGAARLRALECRYELTRLLAQRVGAGAQRAHHLRELHLGVAALALQAGELRLDLAELLVHGLHEPLELLRATGHLAGGALLLGPARLGHALRERIAGLLQHVQGDRLQLVAQALALLNALCLVRLAALTAATAPQRHGARGAEQESDYQQQNAHGRLTMTAAADGSSGCGHARASARWETSEQSHGERIPSPLRQSRVGRTCRLNWIQARARPAVRSLEQVSAPEVRNRRRSV